jgi:predicted phage terminase large subunit-like protein
MKIEDVAERGRRDLYFFSKVICGYGELGIEHKKWCEWLQTSTPRKLRLAPRQTFKSTIHSICYPLWLLVNDREIVRGVKGCDLRIAIASATDPLARSLMREVDGIVLRNELFRRCYGALESNRWSEGDKFISTRKINSKEPTISSLSVGSKMVSSHYDLLVIDDLADQTSRDSSLAREACIQWLRDASSMLMADGQIVMVGTRQSDGDLYHHVTDELNPQLKAAGKPAWDVISEGAYLDDGIAPRYPEQLDAYTLENLKIQIGSFSFASQYENQPIPGDALLFKPEQLSFYDLLPDDLEYFGACDPSLGASSKSDMSCVVTIGKSQTGEIYLVDVLLERLPPSRLRQKIVQLFSRYTYNRFGGEEVAFQSILWDDLEQDLKKAGHPHRIKRIKNTSNKIGRIQASEPQILACRYPSDLSTRWREAYHQLTTCPHSKHDDFPDALQMALSLVGTGISREAMDRLRAANSIHAHHVGTGAAVRQLDKPKQTGFKKGDPVQSVNWRESIF